MAEKKVIIQNLKKSFGDNEVLKDINLSISEGEVVCIGPSGSGKSTLLRCINRLETIDGGQVTVDGFDMSDPKLEIDKARENIGMVFQQFNLFPHKTVKENITLAPVELGKMSQEEADKKALSLLADVGLESKADAYPCLLYTSPSPRD